MDRESAWILLESLPQGTIGKGYPASAGKAAGRHGMTFFDFAAEGLTALAGIKKDAARYWGRVLAGGVARVALSGQCGLSPCSRSPQMGIVRTHIEPDLREQLSALARRRRVSMFVVLLAAMRTVLLRYGNTDPVAVLGPVSMRPIGSRSVGPFINMVPFVLPADGNATFAELLTASREAVRGLLRYSRWPLAEVARLGDSDLRSQRGSFRQLALTTTPALQP